MLNHIRRWRGKRGVAAMAEELPHHQEHEILAFIDWHYPELKDRREVAITLVGGIYTVALLDQYHVKHTLKIDAKRIGEDQIIRARLDQVLAPRPKTAQDVAKHVGRSIGRKMKPDSPQ